MSSIVKSSQAYLDTSGDAPVQRCEGCDAPVGEPHEPPCTEERDPEGPDCQLMMRQDDEGRIEFVQWIHAPDCPHHGEGASLEAGPLSGYEARVVRGDDGPIPSGYVILYDADERPVGIAELGEDVVWGDDDAGVGES